MPNMAHGPQVKAFEEVMRMPPAGTSPIGYRSYDYGKDQGDQAGAQLSNPLEFTKENLMRGQTVYNTYCIVCHGERGQGDGYIVPKFPRPPTLHSDKVRDWSDGRIFHVITAGQNLMPAYEAQIRPEDRWAIVKYVRVLQRAEKPTPQDVEELKKILKEGKL